MSDQQMIPAQNVNVAAAGRSKVYHYEDLQIPGARLMSAQITIQSNDEVELSAVVESENTQTKENGPHHILRFTESDSTVASLDVFMGEFHWKCGFRGVMRLGKNVKGSYSRSMSHPGWTVKSPGPFPC